MKQVASSRLRFIDPFTTIQQDREAHTQLLERKIANMSDSDSDLPLVRSKVNGGK